MSRRRDRPLPRGLERALHGGRTGRAAADDLRPPQEWELVVAAVELALLAGAHPRPPAGQGTKPARAHDPERKPSR